MAGLRYQIGADASKFDSAMSRARDSAVKTTGEIASRFVDASARIDTASAALGRMPGVLRTVAAGFVGLQVAKLALSGIETLTRAAADEVERLAKVGADAGRLGVSTGFLQSMTLQARDLKVEADDVTRTLERLRDASIVKLGEGGLDPQNESTIEARLRRHQKAGNITATDISSVTGADDNEARFRALLELMARLRNSGRELAALDIGATFMTPAMLDRVRQGSTELDKLRTAAATVKSVDIFDSDTINRAQELDRRLKDAQHTLQRGLKPVYDDLTLAGYALHRSNVEWVEFLAARIPAIIDLYRNLRGAAVSAASGYVDLFQAANRIGLRINDAFTGGDKAGQAAIAAGASPDAPAAGLDPDMAAARDRLRRTLNPTSVARAMAESERNATRFFPDKSNSLPNKASGGTAAAESLDEVERFINVLTRQNDVLKAEFDALGKANVEREKGVALARLDAAGRAAGRDATEAERAKVTELAEAHARLNGQLQDGQQRLRENAEAMRHFGQLASDAFADMVLEGRSFEDTLASISKSIARSTITAAFTGTGPLAGVLGLSAPASAGPNGVGGPIGHLTPLKIGS